MTNNFRKARKKMASNIIESDQNKAGLENG